MSGIDGAEGRPSGSSDQERSEEAECLPGGRSERRGAARSWRRDRAGRRRFSRTEREELLEALVACGEDEESFCRSHDLSLTTLRAWQARKKLPQRETASAQKGRPQRYTPEQKRAALEAFERSGRTQAEFAALWGISAHTLAAWSKRYAQQGAKGLEPCLQGGPGRPRAIPEGVRAEIAETKRRYPSFGLRKVRDWLARFRGIEVSAGTVKSALRERGIQSAPPPRRARRRVKVARRFERARPMQLWQTDITSYVLTRHSTRVYLVVFLDDRSRYVVAWSLCTHAKTEMVQECLLDGIARFGKPEEVLSDQGPQYYSWRGKSGFQKLLEREGIRHVVARTHHPQTLGKCERLWKTIGEELWERARPQDLAEARERLGHYFAHYNHFRPHQGIDGLVPADRFFNAEDALRRTLEKQMSANELASALVREPRQPVYLFGQIGEQQVSLVGEHGRVVVHTDDGRVAELAEDTRTSRDSKETRDAGDEHERTRDEHDERAPAAPAAHAHGAQADALCDPGASCTVGAGAVAGSEPGGARPGARAVDGDPGVLAGQDAQAGDRAAPGGAAAAGLAALADGAVGDAGGPLAAAQDAAAGAAERGADEPPGRSAALAPADPRAGAQALADGGPGAGPEGPALGSQGDAGDGGERGGDAWQASKSTQASTRAPWGAGIHWR